MKKEKSLLEQMPQPHDLDTENAVLATLMRYNEKYQQYSDLLGKELFYYEREKAIYKCIEGVICDGHITDINSLFDYSQSHDLGYKLERFDFVNILQLVSKETLEQDIKRLRDMGRRRMCWLLLQQSSAKVLDLTTNFDDEVNGVISAVGEVQSGIADEDVSTYADGLREIRETVTNNVKGIRQSLKTGFKIFDEHYLLRPQTLTIIAAFPAVGKSALALNIAEAVAKDGDPVAYYSMEMGKSELVSRSISQDAELPAYVIMNRPLNRAQREHLDEVIERYKNLPIFFDDRSTVSFDKVLRSIRRLVKTKGIKLAIIDYLQIFNQTSDDEEQGMSYMARMCKNIAKETGIPIIALSQLNRSAPHPSLRMLRGSGQIEESADNVVLVDRPEAYPDNKVKKYEGEFKDSSIEGTAKLILAKGRGVGVGCSLVAFSGKYTRFSEIQKVEAGHYQEQTEDLPF